MDGASGSESGYRIVMVTAPAESAGQMARALVKRGLAACVNVVPGLKSIYRWRGNVEESSEVLLIAKTTSGAVGRLIEAVRELHPYEVPEIVSIEIAEGLPEYLRWISESVP
ncbi:divalent-cation tolerance protein CutA [Conexivisphaera calida]|uniref:Periplasmic divalent cation tolerance protein CutA n=1 Tax=Conexivisphaera calida TaxID=1874277 RepID=A0A4P2VCV9_9ARCH|nr:divalent-cation tolerance protein CutA [Conexivisphaera calida]BBE41981.1 Periplasmic divalent cation tolerance protein CutA [Conexivisphaera calida]